MLILFCSFVFVIGFFGGVLYAILLFCLGVWLLVIVGSGIVFVVFGLVFGLMILLLLFGVWLF